MIGLSQSGKSLGMAEDDVTGIGGGTADEAEGVIEGELGG